MTDKAGLATATGDVARWTDLDHEGDVDLVTASADGWRNLHGRFEEQGESLPWEISVGRGGPFDLDATGNGKTELLRSAPNGDVALLRKNTPGGQPSAQTRTPLVRGASLFDRRLGASTSR